MINESITLNKNVLKEKLLSSNTNALSYKIRIDEKRPRRVNGFAVKFPIKFDDSEDKLKVYIKTDSEGDQDENKIAKIIKYQLSNRKAIIIATLENPVTSGDD